MNDFDISKNGISLGLTWDILFLVGLAAFFILITRLTWKTHRPKLPTWLLYWTNTPLRLSIFSLLAILTGMFALVGLILFFNLYGAVWIPGWAVSDTRSGVIGDLITGLIALFGVPFAIWRILIASQQANIADKGLIAERFSKAVSQITAEYPEGKPNIISRISGLNEMAQIAHDYGEAYQRRVAITMCEFIRFNCTQQSKTLDKKALGAYALRADVAVAFDILENLQSNGYNERLNLTQTDFTKLSLANRTLHNADFHGSVFTDTYIDGVDFSGGNFQTCDFTFPGPDDSPQNYTVSGMSLRNTTWKHTQIKHLLLHDCDFRGALFMDYQDGANWEMYDCKLEGAGFRRFLADASYFRVNMDISSTIFSDEGLNNIGDPEFRTLWREWQIKRGFGSYTK